MIQVASGAERERRIANLRRAMAEAGLVALVVAGREDVRYRGRAFYVTDYWQLLGESHVIITPTDGPIFIGNTVWGLSQSAQSDWITEQRISGTPGIEIGEVLKEKGITQGRVGIVGLSDAGVAYQHVKELEATLPAVDLVDATKLFEDARQANSAEELEKLSGSSDAWNSMYEEIETFIKPGVREVEIAGHSHRIAREHGLKDPMVLVWSDPFSSNTSFGTNRELSANSLLTVWIESAGPEGYWLEYRRCYSLGRISSEHAEYWSLIQAGVKAGVEELRPGNMASAFVEKVAEVLAEGGLKVDYVDAADQHRQYSIHGIGSDAIQGMWAPGNDRVLVENEVVNIHPFVSLPTPEQVRKFGALGITDNILVTPSGGQFLTHDADLTRAFRQI
jgi:Xaa-Pro aminopeptidase